MDSPPPPSAPAGGAGEVQKQQSTSSMQGKREKGMHRSKGSWVGSLVRKDAAATERKARKKAGKQEKKREKKVRKLEKKEKKAERKAEKKGDKQESAAAGALRTHFDQFIIAHRPTRRPGTHWEYLDIKSTASSSGVNVTESLVFLPPGALRPEAFFEILTRLAQRFRVLAVVFRGDFLAIADYVAGVELIMSHASVSKAHIVGVGFGAFVAHQLLAQRPEIFSSLAMAFGSPPNPELGKLIRRFTRSEHVEKTSELQFYFAGFREKLRDEPEARELTEQEHEFWLHVMKNFGVGKKRADELLPRFEAVATHHLEARFEPAQFARHPVLVLDSDTQDRAAVARSFTRLHPDAQVQLLPHASHLSVVLKGRLVCEKLETFYTSLVPPAQVMAPIEANGKDDEGDVKKEKKSRRTKDARPS